jgi:hypothetical protein
VFITVLAFSSLLPACKVDAPDPKPICEHLESLAQKEDFAWDAKKSATCISAVSAVPERDQAAWARELECLGEAPDLASARECADWLFVIQ